MCAIELKGFVYQHYVRSASAESAANANRIIAAALCCFPTPAYLAVLGELHVKRLCIFFRFHEVAGD